MYLNKKNYRTQQKTIKDYFAPVYLLIKKYIKKYVSTVHPPFCFGSISAHRVHRVQNYIDRNSTYVQSRIHQNQ